MLNRQDMTCNMSESAWALNTASLPTENCTIERQNARNFPLGSKNRHIIYTAGLLLYLIRRGCDLERERWGLLCNPSCATAQHTARSRQGSGTLSLPTPLIYPRECYTALGKVLRPLSKWLVWGDTLARRIQHGTCDALTVPVASLPSFRAGRRTIDLLVPLNPK